MRRAASYRTTVSLRDAWPSGGVGVILDPTPARPGGRTGPILLHVRQNLGRHYGPHPSPLGLSGGICSAVWQRLVTFLIGTRRSGTESALIQGGGRVRGGGGSIPAAPPPRRWKQTEITTTHSKKKQMVTVTYTHQQSQFSLVPQSPVASPHYQSLSPSEREGGLQGGRENHGEVCAMPKRPISHPQRRLGRAKCLVAVSRRLRGFLRDRNCPGGQA